VYGVQAKRSTTVKRGRANILTPAQLDDLLGFIQQKREGPRHTLRDFAMVMFGYRGGLRACEIAGINWKDVTDVYGRVGKGVYNPATKDTEHFFEVPPGIAKKSSGRFLPMHPALKGTLEALQGHLGPTRTKQGAPVIQSNRGDLRLAPERMSAHNVVVYMSTMYEEAGFRGCSSHSGRRTLITSLARVANHHDCSLIDVQKIAGHANLADTQVYVEASPFVGQMVRSL
jgi:integrase/recombinase XerD